MQYYLEPTYLDAEDATEEDFEVVVAGAVEEDAFVRTGVG